MRYHRTPDQHIFSEELQVDNWLQNLFFISHQIKLLWTSSVSWFEVVMTSKQLVYFSKSSLKKLSNKETCFNNCLIVAPCLFCFLKMYLSYLLGHISVFVFLRLFHRSSSRWTSIKNQAEWVRNLSTLLSSWNWTKSTWWKKLTRWALLWPTGNEETVFTSVCVFGALRQSGWSDECFT